MKRRSRIIISFFVILTILSSLMVCASAEDKKIYTCLGDSNAAGYATEGYTYSRVPAPNAYHTHVAKRLNAELLQFGSSGFRTDEMCYMLDPDFEMDWAYSEVSLADVKKHHLDAFKDDYIRAIEVADYISIQVGPNDIMSDDFKKSRQSLNKPVEEIQNLKSVFSSFGFDESILGALDSLEFAIQLVQCFTDFFGRLDSAYAQFHRNWDSIIEHIYRLNPDVTIVAISTINALNNTSLNEGDAIKFGKFFDLVFSKMNNWIAYGSEYADTYYYCDLTDMVFEEAAYNSPDFWNVYLDIAHHSEEQHLEIANRIVNIIETGDIGKTKTEAIIGKTYAAILDKIGF